MHSGQSKYCPLLVENTTAHGWQTVWRQSSSLKNGNDGVYCETKDDDACCRDCDAVEDRLPQQQQTVRDSTEFALAARFVGSNE